MYSRLYSHQHLIVLYPDGIITLSEEEIHYFDILFIDR